jgi:two-component system, chemotaxis family, protein-glutamate methylesterase/glutaminase
MDINMPGMDGLTALQHILSQEVCPVVMVSSLTQEGAVTTFEALELGAFDYVPKPGGTISLNMQAIKREIISKVKAAAASGKFKILKKPGRRASNAAKHRERTAMPSSSPINAVVIGVSTGGPKTLMEIIPELPKDLNAALFIVQHMPPNFTTSFAKRLHENSNMDIKEAEAGDTVLNSQGYLARGGYHLQLRQMSQDLRIRLNTTPEHLFIPSVGVMMSSVLSVFRERTIGVLLTGMGDDGADAMVEIQKAGGHTIAESEETAIVFGMPKEAIVRGGASVIAPSYHIADEIVKAVKRLG